MLRNNESSCCAKMKMIKTMNLKACAVVGAFFWAMRLMSATQYANGYTWTYQIKGNSAEIYGHYASGSGAPAITPEPTGSASITIPSTLGGKPVTGIGDYAFYCCDGVWSVTIPSSVTHIGNSAFIYCSIRSVTIPSSVTSIGDRAFYSCTRLASVTMLRGVRSIGDCAFRDCANLASVVLPDSVTIIGHEAFKNCKSLKNILIPSSVTSIGDQAFDGCGFKYSKVKWTIRNGELTDVDLNGETDITIPNSVEIIGADAFRYCHYDLRSVVIPDSITLIRANAFADCRELTSVVIGRGVTHIDSNAFRGCGALRSVMLLVTSLPSCGNDAFKQVSTDCVAYVDSMVEELQDGDRWNNMIVVKAPLPYDAEILSRPTFTIQYGELKHVALNGATEVVIPSSVTRIEDDAFDNCLELKSVLIPVSVTSLYSGTFRNCNNLTNITMLATMTRVDDGIFQGCNQLSSVTIGGGVKEVGNEAFRYCDRLSEVFLCGSVKEIGFEAFACCRELRDVTISDGVARIGECAFGGCYRLANVVIPDSVTSIGERAFDGCNELTKLTIGRGLGQFGENALSGCHNLANVVLPDSVTSIGVGAFADCCELKVETYCPVDVPARMVEWTIRDGEILEDVKLNDARDVTIPSFVVRIRDRAFPNCSTLKSILIPNSVSDIEVGALDHCNGLTNVSVGAGNVNYSSSNGLLLSKDGKLLVRGVNGDVTIPTGVVSIGDRAFYDCCDLMNVTMPIGLTSIMCNSFDGCSSLKCVMIPSSVTSIAGGAFRGCHDLSFVYVDKGDGERVKGLYAWPSNVEFVEFVTPLAVGDLDATVTGDVETGFVVKPSNGTAAVEVKIPQGVDAAKVTVEVSAKVATVKPNGAKVKVVDGENDITNYLVIPESDGEMNIAAATVKEEIVKETLDPAKDAVIELNAANPRLTTAPTRKGLTYTLYEGQELKSLSKGDSKLGDGNPWSPEITVKGGTSAFYSITVEK